MFGFSIKSRPNMPIISPVWSLKTKSTKQVIIYIKIQISLHRLYIISHLLKHANRFHPHKSISINLSVRICVKNLCYIISIYFYILRPYTQVLIGRYFEILFDRYYSRWRFTPIIST